MTVGVGRASWPLWARITLTVLLFAAGCVWAAVGMGLFARLRSNPTSASTSAPVVQVTLTGTGRSDVLIVEGSAMVYRSTVNLPFTWTGTSYDPQAGVTVTASGAAGCVVDVHGRQVDRTVGAAGGVHCGG